MLFDEINRNVDIEVDNSLNSKLVKGRQILTIFLVSIIIIWDIYLYLNDEKESLGSLVNENVKGRFFVISWLWGILSAHLFMLRKKDHKRIPEKIAIMILMLFSILLFLLGYFIPSEIPQYLQLLFIIFGAITGYYLWPQTLIKTKE